MGLLNRILPTYRTNAHIDVKARVSETPDNDPREDTNE